ncbi:MAG TPA: hypothetical protein VGH72_15590, partial [Pseudonocardia sp.]
MDRSVKKYRRDLTRTPRDPPVGRDERGVRDGGVRDGGVRDGGVRDGGVRDGGVRDGGVRDYVRAR